MLKSGMLLKNAIGLAGVLGIVFLCAYPIGKMVFYTLLYHFSAAAVEAVAEPGVLSCISCSAHAAGLLLYTVCTGVLLFMLTIGITMASANV
jgi:stage III sporulation protein AE